MENIYKKMEIIGICGFVGSGKDTFTDMLVEHGYVKLSFSSILKDVLSIIFNWDRNLLEGLTHESRLFRETVDIWWSYELKIQNFTPRLAMTLIGTDLFRNKFNDNIWILAIKRKLQNYKKVVISDCRFNNEIQMIKSLGGKIINIERNNPIWFKDYKSGIDCIEASKLHISETEWIRNEYEVIENNGSIEDLKKKINNLIN